MVSRATTRLRNIGEFYNDILDFNDHKETNPPYLESFWSLIKIYSKTYECLIIIRQRTKFPFLYVMSDNHAWLRVNSH